MQSVSLATVKTDVTIVSAKNNGPNMTGIKMICAKKIAVMIISAKMTGFKTNRCQSVGFKVTNAEVSAQNERIPCS